MKWPPPHLEPLHAVVAAAVDETGTLIGANQGFLRLIDTGTTATARPHVAEFFIQPNFATLVHMPAGADGEIYRGLLTCGEYTVPGRTQTLHARVWRASTRLHLLAEHDIAALEQLQKTVLEVNRDYARAQIEVVQANHRLQQREARLRQLVDELTAANVAREQAQDKLLQAEKLASIGFLAAGVAHEINNPIGFVNSNLGTLERYVVQLLRVIDACATTNDAVAAISAEVDLDFIRADIGPLLDDSRAGIGRVSRIVQAMRDFSGIDAIESWQAYDLNAGIAHALDALARELRHCEIRKALGALPPVECIIAQLDQVFMNLLLNAAQAVDGHGIIDVRSSREGDGIRIEIADSGRGIAPENLARIFDPFFTTRPPGQGMGLGLAVS